MNWIKAVFVMVTAIRLDSIQSEVFQDENESRRTEFFEIMSTIGLPTCERKSSSADVRGCRSEDGAIFNITWYNRDEKDDTQKLQSKKTNSSCYEFKNINGSFITNTYRSHYNSSSCEEYVVSSYKNSTLYYINGDDKSKLIYTGVSLKELRECTSKEQTCDAANPAEICSSFKVSPSPGHDGPHKYINLNISWYEIDKDGNVTIRILHNSILNQKTQCLQESHIINYPLRNKSVSKPNMVTEDDIDPGCAYDIFITSDPEVGINCSFTYLVPDCVGSKCDCDKYKPDPKILTVDHISDNKFSVKWDPGASIINNISYVTTDVYFTYYSSNKAIDIDTEHVKDKNVDLEHHTSEIAMKLFEGENYTLIGIFENNISCPAKHKKWFIAPTKSSYNVFYIIFALTGLLSVVIYLGRKKIQKYKDKLVNLLLSNREANTELHEGARLHPGDIPMIISTQYTPAEFLEGIFDHYEFPRNKIILKEVIGSGAFGQVYSAKAIGMEGTEGYRMVAVKTLGEGENITREATNDFKAEIEIFKKIGNHPNIVALLGCCTVDTPYMMIMEFVPCGDLKSYLVALREQWLKRKIIEKNKQVFFPDNSDGAYIEPLTPTSNASITSSRLPSTSETVSTILEEPMTPLLEHYSHALEKVLDHTELQSFALQIARGMAHLENINVTHRDLAARNILINEYKQLKISDFGLSRSGPYINYRTKKLPLRWMAIEAIIEQKYDSKSDVWSFGVVLWEIGTLGAFPYESVPDLFVQQFLQMGRRLERPEICTDELYSVMQQCWAADPDKRPSFEELVDALDVKKKKVYVNFNQLNPTYVFPPSDLEKCPENPVRTVDIFLQ